MVLFVDTETTGLPRDYYELEDQPYVVQIAAILCDEAQQMVASMNRIILPEGWTIPMEATAIHGYTTAFCRRNGIPLPLAMRELLTLWQRADRVVAYNIAFDQRMLDISARRAGMALPSRDMYCAMQQAAKVVGDQSGRWLKLDIAYSRLFGTQFENAHDALADVEACRAVYYAIERSVAPVTHAVGDTRGLSRSKLQKALAGIEEVEEHQRLISSFITLHHTPAKPVDWKAIASMPDPTPPVDDRREEQSATQKLQNYRPSLFARLLELDQDRAVSMQEEVAKAKERDRQRYRLAVQQHQAVHAAAEQRRTFAQAILTGDVQTYNQFLASGDMFESPLLARNVLHSFVDGTTVELVVYVNGPEIIPAQTKKLLASGRVSTRKTSQKDFVALYQDHVCSAVLRIARDFFAILPLQTVLVHAYAPHVDTTAGQEGERCVLSCVLDRKAFAAIDFSRVDPSDCIGRFPHAMAIRKGELHEVNPLHGGHAGMSASMR